MTKTLLPEHSKLKRAIEELQTGKIADFLVWCRGQGFILCSSTGSEVRPYMPVRLNTSDLLAKYADIDVREIEKERRSLLDGLGQTNTG